MQVMKTLQKYFEVKATWCGISFFLPVTECRGVGEAGAVGVEAADGGAVSGCESSEDGLSSLRAVATEHSSLTEAESLTKKEKYTHK